MQTVINAPVAVPTVQPFNVTLTLENADEIRWFYHLMNFQAKEIEQGYNASSKGSFDSRFMDFETPDKKDLFRAIKAHAADNAVSL